MKSVIAPAFRSQFQELSRQLSQAVLLTGEKGIGLTTIARGIAGPSLEQIISPVNAKDEIDEARGSINVETIRALYETTRGKSSTARVVIIDSADRMTPQAQNAFLKLLEEPPSAMKFILTSTRPNSLLPTVRSRVQQHQIPRISDAQSQKILDQYPELGAPERSQLLFIAAGRPAKLHTLAASSAQRQQVVDTMRLARQFIATGSSYQRIKLVAGVMSSRDKALDFVECCLSILWHQLPQASDAASIELTRRMLHAHDMLSGNANPRLQLIRIVLQ